MKCRSPIAVLAILTVGGLAWGQAQPPAVPVTDGVTAAPASPALPMAGPVPTPAPITAPECLGPDGCGTAPGPCPRLWANAEYLVWWLPGQSLVPLLTASPAGTSFTRQVPGGNVQIGVLGQQGTAIVFGGDRVNDDARSGMLFSGGCWIDDDRTIGIEVSYFTLEDKTTTFAINSNGSPILARPFLNAAVNTQAALAVAFPGIQNGGVRIDASTNDLNGWDALIHEMVRCSPCYRVDLVAGYRYLRYTEQLGISQHADILSGMNQFTNIFQAGPGTEVQVGDHFATKNEFQGMDMGFATEFRRGPWSLGVVTKCAVGWDFQVIQINGNTTFTPPGQPSFTNQNGLLTQPTNIGYFSKNKMDIIPEFDLTVSYQFGDHLRVHGGYSIFYWHDVARAGDQVDFQVNPNPALVASNPTFHPRPTDIRGDLWVQGLNVGLEVRY